MSILLSNLTFWFLMILPEYQFSTLTSCAGTVISPPNGNNSVIFMQIEEWYTGNDIIYVGVKPIETPVPVLSKEFCFSYETEPTMTQDFCQTSFKQLQHSSNSARILSIYLNTDY